MQKFALDLSMEEEGESSSLFAESGENATVEVAFGEVERSHINRAFDCLHQAGGCEMRLPWYVPWPSEDVVPELAGLNGGVSYMTILRGDPPAIMFECVWSFENLTLFSEALDLDRLAS